MQNQVDGLEILSKKESKYKIDFQGINKLKRTFRILFFKNLVQKAEFPLRILNILQKNEE